MMTIKFVKKSILIFGLLTLRVVRSLLPPFGNFRTRSVPNTAFVPETVLPKRSKPSTLQIFASDPEKDLNFEELQRLASDPVAFEAYVLQGRLKEKQKMEETEAAQLKTTNSTTKGYVPIEQWDKERTKDDMSWEERVQYDGQRFGNRFNQNEILRHYLKTW